MADERAPGFLLYHFNGLESSGRPAALTPLRLIPRQARLSTAVRHVYCIAYYYYAGCHSSSVLMFLLVLVYTVPRGCWLYRSTVRMLCRSSPVILPPYMSFRTALNAIGQAVAISGPAVAASGMSSPMEEVRHTFRTLLRITRH
jgi:hypothetical protein